MKTIGNDEGNESNMETINVQRLEELFKSCLYNEDEIIDGNPVVPPIEVEGIMTKFGLHPERTAAVAKEVRSMLKLLPDNFYDGWSFLYLCEDRNGYQWTGEHRVCEQLMVLAMANKQMAYGMPREMWSIFPSGMPYVIIKTEGSPAT